MSRENGIKAQNIKQHLIW